MRLKVRSSYGVLIAAALAASCSSASNTPTAAAFTMTQTDEDYVVAWELYNHMNALLGGASWSNRQGQVNASGACRPSGSYSVTGTVGNGSTNVTLQLSSCGGFLHDSSVYGGYVMEVLNYSGQIELTLTGSAMTLSSPALTAAGTLQGNATPLPVNATLSPLSGYDGCAMSYDSTTSSGSICGRSFSAAAASAAPGGGGVGGGGGGGGGACNVPQACTDLTNTCSSNPESQAPCYCAAACVDQAGISNPSGCCNAGMEQSCVSQLESDCQMQQASAMSLGTPCGYPCQ